MKKLIIILLAFTFACYGNENEQSSQYEKELTQYREDVVEFFKSSEESPVKGLEEKILPEYFEPNEKYKVTAFLEEFPEKDTVEMLTTKENDIRQMIKYGKLKFKIDGKDLELTVYQNTDNTRSFFLPFTDESNGNSTYSMGRYLDIEKKPVRRYKLDFNLAYNPYCYYNDTYSCPIVPNENHLNIKIEAGEKADNEKD